MPTPMLTTMPKPTLVLSSPSHLAKLAPLSLQSMPDMIPSQEEHDMPWNVTWSPHPGSPERARRGPGRASTRPSPRCIRPPLDPSFHLQHPLDVSYLLDTTIGSLAPCRRRHHRPLPRPYCKDGGIARTPPSSFYHAITLTRTAMMPASLRAPHLAPSQLQTMSPCSTSPCASDSLAPYK
jgi:hypothetical protein